MAHQLVRAGARDPLDEQYVDGVLQHRAVTLLLDVLEVFRRRPIHRIVLAHVAEPAGVLGETLAVACLPAPLHFEMLWFEELRTGEQRDARRTKHFHRGYCASSRFGVAHAALRSTSRSRVAMSSGKTAAPAPILRATTGDQSVAGMITPGFKMDSGS